ncbi:hypothetical protein NKR19_g10332 [Coniochaeta hoffmannii]|uniref:Uncharacterized protein n=1 Tax=Coniochaeta hoffmannii TaxID=91930 RepID=A0AA38VFR0_9PEZI|nr:hypothetical protein NKR19_g10332 [Coniochaeta hoffmannii]
MAEVAAQASGGASSAPNLKTLLLLQNARESKSIYVDASSPSTDGRKRIKLDPALAAADPDLDKTALSLRLHAEYKDVLTLPEVIASKLPAAGPPRRRPEHSEAPAPEASLRWLFVNWAG